MNGPARVRLLPAARRVAVPWKNGGGLTREIAAAPEGATLAGFDWRVSTAEVNAAGDFSLFPGVDRTLCVLEGALLLSVDGRAPLTLGEASPAHAFAADVASHGTPVGGAVTDLNVMVRRGRFTARVTREHVTTGSTRACEVQAMLIFALAPLTLEHARARRRLGRWDAAWLERGAKVELSTPAREASIYRIELALA